MKRATPKLFVGVALLILLAGGLLLARNHELDAGAAALKTENGTVAIQKLKLLASLGDRTAQSLLGYAYAFGWAGIAKNSDEAMYWFSRRGVFGKRGPDTEDNPGAAEALSVARAYANGTEGVQVDSTESEKWLRQAAREGSKDAIALLSKQPR